MKPAQQGPCKIIRTGAIVGALILALGSFPARAGDFCGHLWSLSDFTSVDPATLASAWLPPLEHLYAAIPSLSPKEEEWLQAEINRSPESTRRAISSIEYAIRNAKRDAASMFASMREIQKQDETKQVRNWILFTYTLMDEEAGFFLSRLVSEGVMPLAAIPDEWTLWTHSGTVTLADSIRHSRITLARHILICTLPEVAGISMRD